MSLRRPVTGGIGLFACWMLLGAASTTMALSCEPLPTVDLVTGASASNVQGVVEYEVIAENSSGIGKSVGATRRIWGDVVVDRWMVTASRSNCPTTPTATAGARWYLLVGSGEAGDRFGISSGDVISDLEAGALSSIVGEPVVIEIGAVDRSMAWIRVNWWMIVGTGVPMVVVGAVVVRRRSGARRDYLF